MYLNFLRSSTAKVKTSGTTARKPTTAVATMKPNSLITKPQQQPPGMMANNSNITIPGQLCLQQRQSRMLVAGQSLAQTRPDNS